MTPKEFPSLPRLRKAGIKELIDEGAAFLAGRGATGQLRRDTEIILSHLLSVPVLELPFVADSRLAGHVRDRFSELLGRRSAGEPVQYVTGLAYFRNLRLEVGPGTLVPRPETEIMVDIASGMLPDSASVCDLGAGSGAIALALATERPDLKVTALEKSRDAMFWLRKNAGKISAENLRCLESELFSAVPGERFDLTAANLPYLNKKLFEELPREIREYEPHTALYGGEDGLDIINGALNAAVKHLVPGGVIILEISPGQKELLSGNVPDQYQKPVFEKDLTGKTRFAVFRVKGQ